MEMIYGKTKKNVYSNEGNLMIEDDWHSSGAGHILSLDFFRKLQFLRKIMRCRHAMISSIADRQIWNGR